MCHSALGLEVNKISYSICLHSIVCFHSSLSIKQYRNISTILSLKKSLIYLTMNRLVTPCTHSNVLILNDMFKTTFANICVNNVCKSVVIKVDNTYISNSFLARYGAFYQFDKNVLVKTNYMCVEIVYKNESFNLFHIYYPYDFTVEM